jgi:polyhydroxyalkanoate synthase subunit PhaC
LLGVCQGGVFSLCYSALNPRRVRNLVTMVTPVDFHTPADLLSKWVRKIDVAAWVGEGNVPGDALNQLFLSLMPFRLTQQKYVDLLAQAPEPGEYREFHARRAMDIRQPRPGRRRISRVRTGSTRRTAWRAPPRDRGARASICATLELPMLNLIGKRDHLVPPDASAALQRADRQQGLHVLQFDLGHIGMYISARAQREVPAAIAKWLADR